MPLYNPNGTPYQLDSPFRMFDPCDPKNQLFSELDAEAIRIGGSPIDYFEVLIQPNTVDPLYLEDRGKLFSPCPVRLYAIYEPPDQVANSTLYGVDVPDSEAIFELNANATAAALGPRGRQPKVGSLIYTQQFCEFWEIIDARQGEFRGWGALHYVLYCKKFQPNASDGTDRLLQTLRPNFPIQ